MKNILLLFLLVLSTLCYSQGPGLGGKLFTAEYALVSGLSSSSVFTKKAVEADSPIEEKSFISSYLNVEHQFLFGFALSRRVRLGVIYRRGVNGSFNEGTVTESNYDYDEEKFITTSETYGGRFLVKYNTVGLSFDFFKAKRGAIAPIGPYFNIQTFLISANAEIVQANNTVPFNTVDKVMDYGLAFNWGTHKPIFGSTLLKIELGFGFTANVFEDGSFTFTPLDESSYYYEEDYDEDFLEKSINTRNYLINALNAKIGIVQAF